MATSDAAAVRCIEHQIASLLEKEIGFNALKHNCIRPRFSDNCSRMRVRASEKKAGDLMSPAWNCE